MFDKSQRTLIEMLFDRNTVDEISGVLEDGYHWDLYRRSNNYFDDGVKYVAGVGYTLETFDSVKDALDGLEVMIDKKRKEDAA